MCVMCLRGTCSLQSLGVQPPHFAPLVLLWVSSQKPQGSILTAGGSCWALGSNLTPAPSHPLPSRVESPRPDPIWVKEHKTRLCLSQGCGTTLSGTTWWLEGQVEPSIIRSCGYDRHFGEKVEKKKIISALQTERAESLSLASALGGFSALK